MDSHLLSVAVAAALLGLSKRSLYNYCHEGIFPCVRIGRRVLIRKADLEFLFSGNSVGTSTGSSAPTHSEKLPADLGRGNGKDPSVT